MNLHTPSVGRSRQRGPMSPTTPNCRNCRKSRSGSRVAGSVKAAPATASTDGDGRWFGSYHCADREPFSVDIGIRNDFGATAASGTSRASSISVRIRGEDVYIARRFAGGEATIIGHLGIG